MEHEDVFHLLRKLLLKCLPNQLPMYAEQALTFIPQQFKAKLSETLNNRLYDIEKE